MVRQSMLFVPKQSCLNDLNKSRRVGDKVPGVVAVLFSPAEVAGLAVMSLKRLVMYEAT